MRKIGIILFSVLMAVLCLMPTDGFAARAVSATLEFDKTNVLDDLMTSNADGKAFDVTDYPFKDGEGARIINFVEYCYSYKENMQSNYALYIYVYNPSGLTFDTDNYGNKIQLAVGYDKDKLPDDYKKFDLIYCNKSESNNYHNLFYKFRISDSEKEILNQVNSNKRRYDVSGFELVTTGASNAVEYLVGGTYTFEGYVKGYGPDINAESNLVSEVEELETVELELKNTFFRTQTSSKGANYQNQLDTVYFNVPNELFDKYGGLQRIKAEWYEYKTCNIIVTNHPEFYSASYPKLDATATDWNVELSNSTYGAAQDIIKSMIGPSSKWVWNMSNKRITHDNATLLTLSWLFNTNASQIMNYSPYADITESGGITSNSLYAFIKERSKGYLGDKLPIKDGSIRADLFADDIDNNRKEENERGKIQKGYSYYDFDADLDLQQWKGWTDDEHSFWENSRNWGFWKTIKGEIPNEIGKTFSPIYILKDTDLSNSDNNTVSSNLLIRPEAVQNLRTLASEKNMQTVLFRFAVSDYYAAPITICKFGDKDSEFTAIENRAYRAWQSVFLDFDIIQLTFNREGIYKVIPVVASPIDIVNPITTPTQRPDGCGNVGLWFVIILLILIGVPLIIALMFKFPDIAVALLNLLIFLAKGLFYVVTSPYWIIKAIVQKVNNKKPAIKKTKPKAKSRKKKSGSSKRKRKSGKPFKKTIDKRKRAAPKKKDGNKSVGYHVKRFFNIVLTIVLFPLYLIVFFVTKSIKDGTPTKDELANKTHKKSKQAKRLVPVEIKNHKDNKGGHPHVIVDGIDNKHISVGLSTKPKKGKNATNYKLEVSPLNDGKQSYMKRQGTVDKKDMYYNSRKGKMAPIDYSKAKEYGDKAKRKYIEKKDKKK